MRILWLDPVNRDPQFLNLLALILGEAGHEVVIRSNARDVFLPPAELTWVPFSSLRRFPRTLHGRPWARLRVGATYHLDWWRAARWAQREGARAVLVSTGLVLPRADAWGLARLRRLGVAPVVLVHKPYWGCFDDEGRLNAGAAAAYYGRANRILTMTQYSRTLLGDLYGLPEAAFRTFSHPHFQALLSRHAVDTDLLGELREWAGSAPVATYASNVTPEHGFDDLLATLPRLAARVPELRVLLLAHLPDGDRRRQVEAHLAAAGLAGRVRCFWDAYTYAQLQACMAVTGVVLTPYRWATQSGVVSMAAGLGVPVAATDVGGLPEMIRSGVNGELAAARAPEALAAAAAKVLADAPGYRERTSSHRDELFGPDQAVRVITESLTEATA